MGKVTRQSHEAGFSLVELIVVMAIFGLLFVSTTALIQGGSRFFHDATGKIDADRKARTVMSYLNGEFRRYDRQGAFTVETPSSDVSILHLAIDDSTRADHEWIHYDDATGIITRKFTNTPSLGTPSYSDPPVASLPGVPSVGPLTDLVFSDVSFILSTAGSANVLTILLEYTYPNGDLKQLTTSFMQRSGS